jgi:2-C-methyl-D-erythritol 4-phosphate cytidylyltransferase
MNKKKDKNIAVIFAGGTGQRMGETTLPKQFLEVYEKPIIIWTLEYFEEHKEIDEIHIACKEDFVEHLENLIKEFKFEKIAAIVAGGSTAQDSIYKGLLSARKNNAENSIVLIHDGVRPFITKKLISKLIASVKKKGSGVTCTPCFETIMLSDDGIKINEVPLRKNSFAAQAPQAFRLGKIIEAHEKTRKTNPSYKDLVDACTLMRKLGEEVYMVQGNIGNIKITKPEDVYILKGLFKYRKSEEIIGISLLEL